MASIGVIGSGTWGTALSVLLNGNGHRVQIWSAIPQEIAELKETRIHRNLPEVRLPEAIGLTDDLQEAMRDKDLLVLAVPSVFVRQTSQRMKPYIKQGQVITNVAKGIEEKSLMTLSQTVGHTCGQGNHILKGASQLNSQHIRTGVHAEHLAHEDSLDKFSHAALTGAGHTCGGKTPAHFLRMAGP